ncbi:unnamed protein product [Adineta ricciae]|uniref:Peptidase M12B domain-containing protein n=1 Tax=Adineta ricciae TaxID=249248 RepID=A0A813WLK9_ADIRI|nr:unnamed protein product [Adineta ricciae]
MNTFIRISIFILLFFAPVQTNAKLSVNELEQFDYEIIVPKRTTEKKRSIDNQLSFRINGFNQRFDLSLKKDTTFLSPKFFVQYFNHTQTWINRSVKRCFYKGYVNDNHRSTVSISLCDGLFGTFIYNGKEYFIEPKPHTNGTTWNFEHLLYTHNHKRAVTKRKNICRVRDNHRFHLDQPQNSTIRKRRKLNFDKMAKHVEILVTYDNSMKEFHADIDVKSYILTLFSYVSHLYSDASIGNNIKIWLVKLVELGKDLGDQTKPIDDAADLLRQFCQWQRDYNTPGTYDAAVLLTRMPLCNSRTSTTTDSKCDTLGITELGTMCNLTSNCAVIRDNGFATAFTIAHEIAHLFGIRHDNDQVCQNFNKEQNLMATSLIFNYNHYKWSNCSQYYFTQYLESNRYSCLNNLPDDKSLSIERLNNEQKARELPGRLNNLDDQCQRAFGSKFEYCKDLSHGPKCARLYCRQRSSYASSCITNHAHWSDGTVCSDSHLEIKRCFHGQCRSTHDLLAVNGDWGDWSPWSSCTRTCGSAIQKSQRFCDNPKPENGGQYCSGPSTQIRTCEDNPPCEDSVDMFRYRQCSKYDNQTIDPSLPSGVRFEPKFNVLSSERCKLICKVSDDDLERSFILSDRVEDGTPCGREDEIRDLCINGICMPIGCDNKYGSNATEDVCGVCNGQNRTCKLIHGQKHISHIGSCLDLRFPTDFFYSYFKGITHIVDIPINTTRVSVTQVSSSVDRYYLAVRYSNGTYALNGLHSLQLYNSEFHIGNSKLLYSGFGFSNESILITGRLQVTLEIQLISLYEVDPSATSVYWEYYTPYDEDDYVRHYEYQSIDHHCDRPCQGYKQMKKCLIHETDYDSIYCLIFKLPFTHQTERCNDHCVLSWTARYQQACSTRCGEGYKRVLFQCTKSSSYVESMDDEVCRKYVGEKPKEIVACMGNCDELGWVYGDWSECYEDGNCVRKRLAQCRNASGLTVPDENCNAEFLFNVERCAQSACQLSQWNFTAWSECDCTSQLRWRNVSCVRDDEQISEFDCLHEPKPEETISCSDQCPKSYWLADAWQACSITCSSLEGVRSRRVMCLSNSSVVPNRFCHQELKPIEQEACTSNLTCLAWVTGQWSTCSATCGLGIQQRHVYCHDLSRPSLYITDEECQNVLGETSKPFYQQNCTLTDCPRWQTSVQSNCTGKCEMAKHGRTLWCSHHGYKVDDDYCLQIYGTKPSITEMCSQEEYCPRWTVGLWSECSVTCGIGIRNRSISCKSHNETVDLQECDATDRPLTAKECHRSSCDNVTSTWRIGDWTECGLHNCLQTRTIECVDQIRQELLPMSACLHSQHRHSTKRICLLPECLEWQIGEWHGCSVRCGFGIEYGSDLQCYTRQLPHRRVNISECESVQPPLPKPVTRRICRRHCIEWRTNDLTKIISFNHSIQKSYSLLILTVLQSYCILLTKFNPHHSIWIF